MPHYEGFVKPSAAGEKAKQKRVAKKRWRVFSKLIIGRIPEIMFDPNSLLTTEELTTPRTPTELACWVEGKCRLIADCLEAKEWALLRKGLSKKFYEEICPLSLFATHLYKERSDIKCVPNLDNRDFDATILDYSTSPPSKLKVEITSAVNGYEEYLRMKYFAKHGTVSVWDKVSASGNEREGHKIKVENELTAHSALLERTFSLIQSAFKGKSVIPNKTQKYGQGHVLIVAFDDWQWFTKHDIASLKAFVEKDVLTLQLDFAALYVVGLSGKTFVHFEPGP